MIILKVTKKQGFVLSLEDKFFEKPQGGWGGGGGGGGQITNYKTPAPESLIWYLLFGNFSPWNDLPCCYIYHGFLFSLFVLKKMLQSILIEVVLK